MSNVNVNEDSMGQAINMLPLIATSLSNLSGDVAAIDLSDIGLGMDLSNTVTLINNVISSSYSDSSISILRKNIEATRDALIKMNSDIGTLFDKIDDYPLDEFGNFTNYVGNIKTRQNSVDLETYLDTLKSQGFTVEKIPNGGYKVMNVKYSVVYYLSDDCTYTDVQLISYYPGGGDPKNDTYSLRTQLENDGVPSGTVAIVSFLPGTWENQETNNSAYDIFERMEKEAGIDVTSVVSMGFSLGGFKAFTRLNDYLKSHENIKGENCAVICIDGITNNTKGWIESDVLAKRNVPVYFVRSNDYETSPWAERPNVGNENCKMLTEMGLNTYLILDNVRNGHMNTNEAVVNTGLYKYLAGQIDTFDYANEYTVYSYVKDQSFASPVPNYYMQDYNTIFGGGTVANNGCGPTAIAMVLSSLLNKEILPSEIAEKYSYPYGLDHGADWGIITKVPLDYGIDAPKYIYYNYPERWNEVVAALERGAVVVTEARGPKAGDGPGNSPFTTGKHFIVLAGITEDGKILVNDPNNMNYNEFRDESWGPTKEVLSDGFANGFAQSVFKCGDYTAFWVFERTDTSASSDRHLISIDDIPNIIELGVDSSVPKSTDVITLNNTFGVLYDQSNSMYSNINYGAGNLSSNGCGFFSLLSVITSKTGYQFEYDEIAELANLAQTNCHGGSNEQKMEYLADYLSDRFGFEWKKGPVESITSSLKNNEAVICYVPTSEQVSSGHFVPITGILENGNVIINDTNGNAYRGDAYYYRGSEKYSECIDTLGFNLQSGEFSISVAKVDKNGDGLNDDVWYFTFNDETFDFDKKPTTPVQKPTTPVQKPTTPVQKPTPPVQKPTTPVQKPTTPVQEPTTSVQKPTTPVQGSISSTNSTVNKPVIEVEESESVEDINEPIIEEEPIIEDEIPIEDNNIPSDNDDGIIVPEPSKSSSAKKFILPGILGAGLAALAAKFGMDFKKKRKDNDEL